MSTNVVLVAAIALLTGCEPSAPAWGPSTLSYFEPAPEGQAWIRFDPDGAGEGGPGGAGAVAGSVRRRRRPRPRPPIARPQLLVFSPSTQPTPPRTLASSSLTPRFPSTLKHADPELDTRRRAPRVDTGHGHGDDASCRASKHE